MPPNLVVWVRSEWDGMEYWLKVCEPRDILICRLTRRTNMNPLLIVNILTERATSMTQLIHAFSCHNLVWSTPFPLINPTLAPWQFASVSECDEEKGTLHLLLLRLVWVWDDLPYRIFILERDSWSLQFAKGQPVCNQSHRKRRIKETICYKRVVLGLTTERNWECRWNKYMIWLFLIFTLLNGR